MSELEEKIRALQGPILVLGASGFIGANLLRLLLRHRSDVYGTRLRASAWRLAGLDERHLITTDLLVPYNISKLLDHVRPMTVFDCVAYGAYSFERDANLIYRTNVECKAQLLEELCSRNVYRYIHAGSSSEYGTNAAGPPETALPSPNSHYAVSKVAAANLIRYYGKSLGVPCANLRLYSVYGPWEDGSRLIPAVVMHGVQKELPPFVSPEISRDFVYVEDACEAFVMAAAGLAREQYGESFNIASGSMTTIAEVASLAREVFGIAAEPSYTMPARDWDVERWFGDPSLAEKAFGWRPGTSFRRGLEMTAEWFEGLPDGDEYVRSSKRFGPDEAYSVSAIVACYKDAEAIPVMYRRLCDVFEKLNIDYEIIFVNDGSPDASEEVIRDLSARNRRVVGISHSRNFGSQAAFRSGMEIATKNACVLLDGDLQDPPELIGPFVGKWREGFDVVYGRRVKREAPLAMQIAYKLFYRVFDRFSYVSIPHDAGDFSLMTRKVVASLLSFPERDLFIRGVRAFAGFRQTGVDYVRPERMFGVSTNSLLKNIGWAKKGILSFSNTPLNILSFTSVILFCLFFLLFVVQLVLKLLYPEIAPKGVTTTILLVILFGAVNLLAVSVVGEYVAKIFEEVKRRPHYIRRSVIRNGSVRPTGEDDMLSGSR